MFLGRWSKSRTSHFYSNMSIKNGKEWFLYHVVCVHAEFMRIVHADVDILWIYIDHSFPNPCPKPTHFTEKNRRRLATGFRWSFKPPQKRPCYVTLQRFDCSYLRLATSTYDCEWIKLDLKLRPKPFFPPCAAEKELSGVPMGGVPQWVQ